MIVGQITFYSISGSVGINLAFTCIEIFGLLAAGIVYFLVTFTDSMVVPTGAFAESSGPLLEVVKRSPISLPTQPFAALALVAVSNGALIDLIMASRVM